ncbi:pyridine nucleotide transhydrogenase, alpha subunit [Legionella drozanskii LLAP-1]|uniref:NAD(P) transhydrogenase subunit alpha part 1 n=1 Tax=Legionella drozanskii LLAP-1 TaxID=1212489 RepID=A0A0W0SKY5_9GAMM|nr:Re/Si-specific NAD(P)(+) transhydrogenase subunit alpha [Legionella drozanskii]KTC83979.1 pyridine nucleotide transhydrogenase, alpha subunit [Legionella drozanskii LLAP-1]
MIIAALNENSSNETRVAITPNAIKHYLKLGLEVVCEKNAGHASGFSDADYEAAGAKIVANRKSLLQKAKILVCVNEPSPSDLQDLAPEALIIAPIDNNQEGELLTWGCKEKMSVFSMNLIPRISRAQSMDSLSSQANLAGYRAVLEAVVHFNRAIPMMMTAAGMIQPAKALILGAGVAGLQAIATAKRLGAVVYAFDVRRAAKEQVESLGAEFIEVAEDQDNETSGGYASETSEEYKRLQAQLIDQYATQSDLVISTALIPGRQAPILLTKETVKKMKPGSVIVDLATSRGGNCEVSQGDKIIKEGEVTIIGYSNIAGLIPATASELYANNLVHLITLLVDSSSELVFNKEDEIIKQALLCHEGNYLPFQKAKETL